MMPVEDAQVLGSQLESASPRSSLLPVLYFPSRGEFRKAEKEFGRALKYPTTMKKLLSKVELANGV